MKYTKTEALVACLVVSSLLIIGYFSYQKARIERRIVIIGQPIPPDPPPPPGSGRTLVGPELEAVLASMRASNIPSESMFIGGVFHPKTPPQDEPFQTFLRARVMSKEKPSRSISVELDSKSRRIYIVIPGTGPSDTVHSLSFEAANNLLDDLSQILESE
jgi:hypothetical protein